jgi:hypothetical protein
MWMIRPAWSIEAAKRTSVGDWPERWNFTDTRGPDGAVTCCTHPLLAVALAIRSSVGESRSTSTLPASPAPWFWADSPIWGAGPWSVAGAPQLVDDPVPPPVPPEAGAVVAVAPVEPPRPGAVVAVAPVAAVVSVVALESVPPPLVPVVEPVWEFAPDPAPAVVDVAPLPEDEGAGFPDVVVAALAGPPFFAPDGDGLAARAGEIATSPTIPAASGNRNRRCMAASSFHLCIFANA